jgi:phage baseplate assembly protein W
MVKFKSTGVQISPETVAETEVQTTPLGLVTPLRPAQVDGSTFEMHFDIKRLLRDNLRNLLATNWGERLGEWDFGANLVEFAMELEPDDGTDPLRERVFLTIARWMPFLTVSDVQVLFADNEPSLAEFDLRVIYEAPEYFSGSDAVVISFNFG